MIKNIKKLALMLGMSGLNGNVALAASSGLFKMQNVLLIAFVLIAGPGAILLAALSEGNMRERILAASVAGIIATIIVMFAAGAGPRVLELMNLNVIKISGGISILLIGLLVMGINIPEKMPLIIVLIGLVLGVILR